eukprot:CAMPEP_0185026742 /NCGR_PEP_ID=MMETSP1103-20130426/11077_1 /TAXON_ID=36769 /ORGANISM="Paraphysomonas bandaiensis, Strain Caron Lab Isolate" /LENGTH=648 /DNA_ID=CAMNT_0027560415 /DNA_START=71 /DNA_END=2018 /DNA_ORIENTATION=-
MTDFDLIATEDSRLYLMQQNCRQKRRKEKDIHFNEVNQSYHSNQSYDHTSLDMNAEMGGLETHTDIRDEIIDLENSRLELQQRLSRQIRLSAKERASYEHKSSALRSDYEAIQTQYNQLNQQFERYQNETNEKITETDASLQDERYKNTELLDTIHEKEALNKALLQKLLEASEEQKQLKEYYEEREKKIQQDILDKIPVVHERAVQTEPDEESIRNAELVIELRSSVERLSQDLDDANYRMEDMQSDVDGIREAYSSKEAELAIVKDSLSKQIDMNSVYEMKLKAANYEIDRIHKNYTQLQESSSRHDTEVVDKIKEIELLKIQVSDLTKKYQDSEVSLQDVNSENEVLFKSQSEMRYEIDCLKKEIEVLQSELKKKFGNNVESILEKARVLSRPYSSAATSTNNSRRNTANSRNQSRGSKVNFGEDPGDPDDMAYTMDFENNDDSPPAVGINGLRSMKRDSNDSSTPQAVTLPDIHQTRPASGRHADEAMGSLDSVISSEGDVFADDSSLDSIPASQISPHRHARGNKARKGRDTHRGQRNSDGEGSTRHKPRGKKKCSECGNRYKGKSKKIPSALKNLDIENALPSHGDHLSPVVAEVVDAGYPLLSGHLDNQITTRDDLKTKWVKNVNFAPGNALGNGTPNTPQ